ncbi:MAG: TonB-dependent receptor [Bacteroidales bacterium]
MKKKLKQKGNKLFFRVLSGIPVVLRITVLLLFCMISNAGASEVYSQSASISLSLQNSTVENVLNAIEEKTEYYFLYNSKLINVDRKVDVDVTNESVEAVLKTLFKASGVKYKFEGKQIILINAGNSFSETQFSQQEQKKVSGVVKDANGEPVAGASVLIKGTTKGIITDIDGKFEITDVKPTDVLLFSFMGMKSVEETIGSRGLINVTMTSDVVGLEEVVAIGYGVQKKSTLTGAASSVKTKELEEISTAALSNTMAGRASGITVVNNSGFAGASSSVRIRGSNSEPLYVIDNIVSGKTAFDALDPNEVEEISFLKDAATAAIYGMKAADGVVLVKTKGGHKNQKAQFSYKGSFSMQEATYNYNDYTALDEVTYRNDHESTWGRDPYYTTEEVAYIRDNGINYDLYDIIWKNPGQQQHTLSATGGSDKVTYYFMAGYHKSSGSYENTDYQKFNFRSNVTADLTSSLKLNVNISANQRESNRFYWPYDGGESVTVQDFYRATFNVSRIYPWYVSPDGTPLNERAEDAIPTVGSGWGFHPGEIISSNAYRKMIYRTANITARLDWDLKWATKGLSTSFMANYVADDNIQKQLRLHQTYYKPAIDPNNKVAIDGSVPISDWVEMTHNLDQNRGENIAENANISHNYQLNWFLNYDRTFGLHKVSAMGVYEQRGYYGYGLNGTAYKLLSSDLDQMFATSSDAADRDFGGSESESAYISFIGRFNYTYAERYIAEFSFRDDGNYRFPRNTRWGFFPSVSAAWRISEEGFMDRLTWLSNLKLRGSFGTSGNDLKHDGGAIGAFMYENSYVSSGGYVFGNTYYNGIAMGAIPNTNITWAKTRTWNVGLDFGFFNNKINGEIDYFYRFNYDLLGSRIRTIPTTWGGSAPAENYIETDIRGIEFSLRYNNNIGEFRYELGANFGYAKDKVLKIDETEGLEEWRSQIGKPRNRLEGYISKGIIRDQATIDALPDDFTQFGRKPMLGTILFEDIRGANYSEGPDGKIDANDKTFLSDNGTPRINYGFFMNFKWRNISLDALFQGVGAYDRMVATKGGSGGVFQLKERPYFGLWTDHWTEENTNADFPRIMGWGYEEAGHVASSFWMKNGAYLRLKNLNLAYDLPSAWVSHLGLGRIQFFLNASNLFTISELKRIMDPEQAALDSYPVMKTYSAGLNVTF